MGIHVVHVLHVIRMHTHVSTQHNTCVDICIHISCHVCIDTHTMYLCMCMYRCTIHSCTSSTTCSIHVLYMHPYRAHVQYSIQYTGVLCSVECCILCNTQHVSGDVMWVPTHTSCHRYHVMCIVIHNTTYICMLCTYHMCIC